LDLLTYSIYIFVSLTRLFLNLYTAHSDVGGTVFAATLFISDATGIFLRIKFIDTASEG
jgi:hypothetical protein